MTTDGTNTCAPQNEIGRPMSLKLICDDMRWGLGNTEKRLRALMKHAETETPWPHAFDGEKYPGQRSEMKAQIMLAVRHVEDARMRIGKILQYADDGVSILEKTPVQKGCRP